LVLGAQIPNSPTTPRVLCECGGHQAIRVDGEESCVCGRAAVRFQILRGGGRRGDNESRLELLGRERWRGVQPAAVV
jgi:hypothetical protein